MKQHISDVERESLALIIRDWHAAKEQQLQCVDDLVGNFDMDANDAVDMLNKYDDVVDVIKKYGIEVHQAITCRQPWKVDGQALCVWLLVIGGGVFVSVVA